jgi:hypothetical protein
MNTRFISQPGKALKHRISLVCGFGIAFGLLTLCFGAGIRLLPSLSYGGNGSRVPTNQFQADVRSVSAALRYLLEPEPDYEKFPTPRGWMSGTIAMQAKGEASPPVFTLLNQTKMPAETLLLNTTEPCTILSPGLICIPVLNESWTELGSQVTTRIKFECRPVKTVWPPC